MPALHIADLFCLRSPAEATLTLVDWYVAQPSTCRFHLAFDGGRGPTVYSNVVKSVSLGLQSALERALVLGMVCPPFKFGVGVSRACGIF